MNRYQAGQPSAKNRDAQAPAANALRANDFQTETPQRPREAFDFTREEHLHVQREIEGLAQAIWCLRGMGAGGGLSDWLAAEDAVIKEFIQARSRPANADGFRTRRAPAARLLVPHQPLIRQCKAKLPHPP